MSEFEKLRLANVARDAEWDPYHLITLGFRGLELGGESGEAQNAIKKIEREKMGLRGSRASKAALAEELADVIIAADLIAMQEGIDLWSAITHKFNLTSMKYNLSIRLTP